MTPRLALLEARVRKELVHLGRLEDELGFVTRVKDAKLNILRLRASASVLHDFYSGIEKVFISIARDIDEAVPKSEGWHRELLQQMGLDIPSIRPAVIDKELALDLESYLSFRHRYRNLYGYELDWSRMEPLVKNMGNTLRSFEAAINEFLDTLSEI